VIRFVWLQSRTQTLIAAAALAALAVAAAITGIQLSHLYSSLVAHCQTGCGLATSQFLSHDHFMDHALDLLAQIAPALIGIFWGAPLVTRELETGTYQLAWTQSVSCSRWLVTKLAVVGFAAVTLAGLLTLTITWWYRALDLVGTNPYDVFDRRDIAPIGYAAFAFASGALIGAVIRRTLPAMATTLVVYVVARIATTFWVRPHLLSPINKTMPLSTDQFDIGIRGSPNGAIVRLVAPGSGPANSWTLSSHPVNSSGHIPSQAELSAFIHQYCPTIAHPPTAPSPGRTVIQGAEPAAMEACRAQVTRMFHLVVTYQPANRYWTFQWLETGVFVALALLAAAGCYWWVTRRTH
jgi:ABC-type transport system involved in multi-copper enzyme maturation permease subunit